MWHQVEFLLEGYVLPMTIEELRISDRFLLESAYPKNKSDGSFYSLAYVATEEKSNYFKSVINYVDFFILIFALVSGQHVTFKTGVGTKIKNLTNLGKKRFTFPDYERIHVISTGKDEFWTKPIFEIKDLFLKLLPSRQQIMDSHVGLALIYYYIAVQASQRRYDQAIINLMIALEALLIEKDDKIRGCISNRIASLIAEKSEERDQISKEMKELYDLRSHIVHGRGKKPTLKDTRLLFKFARKSIQKTLSFEIFSKKELIKKISDFT